MLVRWRLTRYVLHCLLVRSTIREYAQADLEDSREGWLDIECKMNARFVRSVLIR